MADSPEIKKIDIEQLKLGMFVHDLGCGWLEPPFLLGRFAVTDEEAIERIAKAGIRTLYIDTERGDDVPYAPTQAEVAGQIDRQVKNLAEERRRALPIYREATGLVQLVLQDARYENVRKIARLNPVAGRIVESIFRHGARIGRDHCRVDAPRAAGDCRRPRSCRAQPRHRAGTDAPAGSLARSDRAAPRANRRQRLPFRRKGAAISAHGKMAAIVDVYDALTSPRAHQTPMTPTEALRKLFEWSGHHFGPALVQAFTRTVGIYPVGSLVRLESGVLGVVVEQTDDLLKPVVRIFYNSRTGNYFSPLIIRVGRVGGAGHGPIVSHESFSAWNLDPARWVPA